MQEPTTDIVHDSGRSRFVTTVDGVQAAAEYHLDGSVMVVDHTEVPEALGGRGIAGALVRAAFEHARREGWAVRAACPYAAAWARRHPEVSVLSG